MKKILLLLITSYSYSQLYVSDNDYVFNKDRAIFVTGTIELNGNNSTFYLREQGQLLQGTAGISTNKGIGKLSVFQEGTVPQSPCG